MRIRNTFLDQDIVIFTDASTSPQKKIAIGAYICLNQIEINQYSDCDNRDLYDKLVKQIIVKQYASKKSTAAEIYTIIDALIYIKNSYGTKQQIIIYTDCQSLCHLLGARGSYLKKNNFMTKTGKILQNTELYKTFFAIADQLQIQAIKVKGHHAKHNTLSIQEKIFVVIDQFCRKQLRQIVKT